jgi:hypothetical protein
MAAKRHKNRKFSICDFQSQIGNQKSAIFLSFCASSWQILCGLCGSTHHGGIHQSRLGDLVDNGLPSGPTKAALASAPQRMA